MVGQNGLLFLAKADGELFSFIKKECGFESRLPPLTRV